MANAITKFSIVSPNADVIWNNITSAMELTLIDFLKEKKNTSIPTILEDVETVIRRIERCSEFADVKTRHKSYDIPEEIKTVLRRYIMPTCTLSLSLSITVSLWTYSSLLVTLSAITVKWLKYHGCGIQHEPINPCLRQENFKFLSTLSLSYGHL